MHRFKPVIAVFYLLMLTTMFTPAATDKITLNTKKSYEGDFTAYKNTRFYFQPKEGKILHEMRTKVVSIEIAPSVKVDLKPRGKKDIKGILFKGYKDSKFTFEKDDKEMTMAASQITTIDVGMDFRRSMMDRNPEKTDPIEMPTEPVDMEKSVKTGVMTIIHIHVKTDDPNPALRMENYVSGLPKKYKGKLVVNKHILAGWEDPTATKYEIKSTPQFWFYNKKGKLMKKLQDRFTDADIESALKAMKK